MTPFSPPRPGYSPLDTQLSEIVFHAEKWPLILVEDGSFTGSTVCTLLKECKERNIKLNFVVIGLLFGKADAAFAEYRDSVSIEAAHIWQDGELIDWMPDHDFFPFIPNSGRTVGYTYRGKVLPIYLHNGISLCMPYILPYGDPVNWASLPDDLRKISAFSMACIMDTIAIFEELESLNNKRITLDDIVATYPRVSFPVTPKGNILPELNERIIDYLSGDAQLIS